MDARPLPEAIARFVREEMRRLQVPGVAVAVCADNAVYAEGFGVTSVDHPLPVTPQTLFQIGSTSKTFTATAAMLLVVEGRLDIEARVRTYLPDFRLGDESASEALTLRHLLTHHGGWMGDYFKDFGRGDDALQRYVEAMARAPQLLPPGTAFSYSNAGFYLLARIIEVVSGQRFEDFVTGRILQPLGMDHSTYWPEEVIPLRTASGHVLTEAGNVVARPWHMARNLNGGGGLASTAIDQARYMRFHLAGGVTEHGERLLPAGAVARMQQPHAPAGSMCDEYGLGWMLVDHNGLRIVKHGGATNGFLSAFELAPDRNYGCTVLTNSFSGRELRDTVADAVREHFLGFGPITWPKVEAPANLDEYAGEYRAMLADITVTAGDGCLLLEARQPERSMYNRGQRQAPEPPVRLNFIGQDRCAVTEGSHRGERCEFLRDAEGRVAWVRWDGRIARRQE